MARGRIVSDIAPASAPLPSPDTEGAVWARTGDGTRIIYGIPGEAAMVALQCTDRTSAMPILQITRIVRADEGASALLAMVGNGHIGRLKVDAIERAGTPVWHGSLAASDDAWEPLAGPRALTLTVPGAGMVRLNPSSIPSELIAECRTNGAVGESAD